MITSLDTDQLEPNPLQPRGNIDPLSLEDLISSIKEHGILEPLIVAQTPAGYQIIAGERRWRAAKYLKIKTIPVVIKKTTPQQMLEMAIVENLQRTDLNPIEKAKSFLRLKDEFNLNTKQIAHKIGKSVPYVINSLKLLELPDTLKDGLLTNLITEGHARALSSIKDTRLMIEAYKIVLQEQASVRRAEDIARRMKKKIDEGLVPITKENIPQFLRSNLDKISADIQKTFKSHTTSVKVTQTNIITRITIQFRGPSDQRFLDLKRFYKTICKKDLLDS